MRCDPRTFARLGVWASLGLALHVGMVAWARAAETDVVPRWAIASCVTVPPGVGLTPEQLAERLASAGLLKASPVGFQVVRGRARVVEDEATRRARISAVRSAAGRAGAAARWGQRVAAAAREVRDRIWPTRQAALPLARPAPVHDHHAVCGRVCLPLELAREFARKLGGADGLARVTARAHAHLAQLGDAPVAGAANDFVYWRRIAATEGWFGRPRVTAAPRTTRPHAAPAAAPVETAGTWGQVLALVGAQVPRHAFLTWFRGTTGVRETVDRLEVRVPDALVRDWIARHYRDVVADALQRLGRPATRVVWLVAGEATGQQTERVS